MLWDCLYQSEVFIDVKEFLPFLKKRLEGKVYELNGYKYKFIKVGWDESLIQFTVNTLLPEKGGGFVLDKIYADVGEIVDNLFIYLGITSTISIQVYVNGKKVESSYLPYDKIQQVFDFANANYSIIKLHVGRDLNPLELHVKYTPLFNYKNSIQFDNGVTFIIQTNVKSILIDGVEKEPNIDSKLSESTFVSYLLDHFEQSPFENAMYEVLEPQLQFRVQDDLYYNAYPRQFYYKGKKIKDEGVNANSGDFLRLFHSSDN